MGTKDQEYFPSPFERVGDTRVLRRDLDLLREYTGKKTLIEALQSLKIKRVLEIGTWTQFGALFSLSYLRHENGKKLLKKEDLWAADTSMNSALSLIDRKNREYINKNATLVNTDIETIAQNIDRRIVKPFDLVFCKGVAAVGNLVDPGNSLEDINNMALEIVASMRDSLNSRNRKALLVIDAKLDDSVLPLSRGNLENLGLSVVHYRQAQGYRADKWVKAFQEADIFPRRRFFRSEVFFGTVVCKRK